MLFRSVGDVAERARIALRALRTEPTSPERATWLERADTRPTPEEQFAASGLDLRIQRALLRLRPNYRQCILLSDLQDMSSQQIGDVMGMSHGAVRTLLCRARQEMRRELAKEGIGA